MGGGLVLSGGDIIEYFIHGLRRKSWGGRGKNSGRKTGCEGKGCLLSLYLRGEEKAVD